MTESEFHAARRMFAIIHHEVKIADAGDKRSHREWFMTEGWISRDPGCTGMEDFARGYYYDGQLVVYKRTDGDDFSHFGVAPLIQPHLRELQQRLQLPDDTKIWFGAKPGKLGDVWQGHAHVADNFPDAFRRLDRHVKESE